MKNNVVRIELLALVVLVGLTLVFGLSKGVWDESSFFKCSADGNKRTFSNRTQQIEFCQAEGNLQELVLSSDGNVAARFQVELAENDPTQTVRFLPENADKVFSVSVRKADDARVIRPEDMWSIRNYLRENAQYDCGISDKGFWKMASGQEQAKMMGRASDILLALLFLGLGLAVTCLRDSLIKLEQSLIGLFYHNAKTLRPSSLGKACWLVLGLILFGIGTVLLLLVLLG